MMFKTSTRILKLLNKINGTPRPVRGAIVYLKACNLPLYLIEFDNFSCYHVITLILYKPNT